MIYIENVQVFSQKRLVEMIRNELISQTKRHVYDA